MSKNSDLQRTNDSLLRLRQQLQEAGVLTSETARPSTSATTKTQSQTVSSELLAAQRELRREQRIRHHRDQVAPAPFSQPKPSINWIENLQPTTVNSAVGVSGADAAAAAPTSEKPSHTAECIRSYPSLNAAILKQQAAALARVWYLMRWLDKDGRGYVDADHVRRALTAPDSKTRVFSWRRLRQLLDEGEGVFWHGDDRGRIWVFSVENVAKNIDSERLAGSPILLSVSKLLGGIAQVRQQFFASFHSGRKKARPISRKVLREKTGVAERTQRLYDKAAGVKVQRNFCIGEKYDKEKHAAAAWEHGRGTFIFTDHQGQRGQKGARYLAHGLPATYGAVHDTAARGRQRKINKRLAADLVNKRARGNGCKRVYFDDARTAGRVLSRNTDGPVYVALGKTIMPDLGSKTRLSTAGIWAQWH